MLFTRCPDCGTTFRITADALRKANGQVRCGRCARVFNAYNELRRRARRKVAAMREEAAAAGAAEIAPATEVAAQAAEAPPQATDGTGEATGSVARVIDGPAQADGAPQPADLAPTVAPTADPAPPASTAPSAASPVQPAAIAPSGSRADSDAPSADDVPAPPPASAPVIEARGRKKHSPKKAAQREKDLKIGDISFASAIAELEASAAPEDLEALEGAKRDAPDETLPSGALLAKNGLAGTEPGLADLRSSTAPSWILVDDAAPRRAPSRAWAVGSIAAVLVLALQVVHHYRDELAVLAVVGPALRHAYEMLGLEIAPHWNLDQYEIVVDWDAVTQPGETEDNRLTIAARIRNKGPSPVPLPHVQVQIKDRWESTLGTRVFTPVQYLPPGSNVDRAMIAGQVALAKLAIVDPGPEAYGFELDVCVDAQGGTLRCAADEVFR